MHYLFGLLAYVCALGALTWVGCGGTSESGSGGTGGDIGDGFPCTEQGILDAIAEGGGPHTFNCDGPTTLAARFSVDNAVILDAEGQIVVDGFDVDAGVRAELRGFSARNQGIWADRDRISNEGTLLIADSNVSGSDGGGISNGGTLTMTNVVVEDNWYQGVYNRGTLTITNSTISENVALGTGLDPGVVGSAGIYNSGTVIIVASTVSRNQDHSEHGGGGIHNDGGSIVLANSTVSANEASGPGGGIFNSGTLTIINSTVSENIADEGSSIYNKGITDLVGSLVEGDCGGSVLMSSGDHNVETPGDTCGFDQPNDQVKVSAEALALGPLRDNGGPTETHALGAGSIALDMIPRAECLDAMDEPLTTDQRGMPRPETGGTMCDVGAFELQP